MDVFVLISRQHIRTCGLIFVSVFQFHTSGQEADPRILSAVPGATATPSFALDSSLLPIRFKGSWPDRISGRAWDVAVVDNLACVSLAEGGLLILDIDHPTGPRPVGHFRALGRGPVAVADGYAYLGANGLHVIQVHNPAQPVRIGGHNGFSIRKLVPAGNRLYAAIEPSGLVVFDVTDKTNPVPLPSVQTNVLSVAVAGSYVYVGGSNYFGAIDASDPAHPRLIGSLSLWPGQNVLDLAVAGNHAFLCHEKGLDIADISRPHCPRLVGCLRVDLGSSTLSPPHLSVSANTAIVGSASQLFLIDLANPADPRLLRRLDAPVADAEHYRANGGGVRGIQTAGARVFLALDYDGLQIINAENELEPRLDGEYLTYIDLRAIAVSGNVAYALMFPAGLHVLDITAPESPRLMGTCAFPLDLGTRTGMSHRGSHVFLHNRNHGLSVVDAGDPANPMRPRQLLSTEGPLDVELSVFRDRAVARTYASSSNESLFSLWDLSQPMQPTTLNACPCQCFLDQTHCAFPGPLFWGRDRFLYLWQEGLRAFDFGMPGAPVQTGFVPVEGSFDVVYPIGDHAFVGGERLLMFDTGNPFAPQLLGCVYTNRVDGLAMQGRYVVLTDASGLKIINVQTRSQAGIVGRYDGAGFGQIALAGDHALIAHGTQGLIILSLGESFDTAPAIVLEPRGLRVVPGESARLEVGVDGTVPLHYQWRFDGADIPGATNAILSLDPIHQGQAGAYSVLVANRVETALSTDALLEVDAPPHVSLTLPEPGTLFLAPATILMAAEAFDGDGTVTQIVFREGTNVIGTVAHLPFSLEWPVVPVGTYTLSALATDNEGAQTASDTLTVTVTNRPVFHFSRSRIEVMESNSIATVVVRRNSASGSARVHLSTMNGSARAVTEAGSGDYFGLATNVAFSHGDLKATTSITIVNDLVYRGGRSFTVMLSDPSEGWSLASPAQAEAVILDDDSPMTTNAFIEVVFPMPAPTDRGSLRIVLEPSQALGGWRFPWETTWRESGSIAGGLVPGNYPVAFRPRTNFLPPEPAVYVIAPGAGESGTNYYIYTGATPEVGSLTVALLPASVATADDPALRGQWRLQGEVQWRDSGSVIANAPVGDHVIEFKPVAGFRTPLPKTISVAAGQTSVANGLYLLLASSPGLAPTPLPGFSAIANGLAAGLPYAFSGQLRSDAGYASGFVVKERTVLTSAHVVFDAATLSYATKVDWFFQRHRDQFEPVPQSPRGWYLFQGYAAARTNDIAILGLDPGESSPASRVLDVAALYFLEDAGRGGYGGYLVSHGSHNNWLQRAALKLLVGYPVENVNLADVGKMHRAGPDFFFFEPIQHPLYRTEDVKSYPGNSGGPLCVQTTNSLGQSFFIPAALYLGGSGETIVRIIDLDTVDLINRAEQSAVGHRSDSDRGFIQVNMLNQTAPPCFGWVEVEVGPSSAVAAGAKWRVSPTNEAYAVYTNYTALVSRIYADAGSFTVELAPVPGFVLPTNQTVTVFCDQGVVIQPRYSVAPPWLGFMDRSSLVATGTPSTTYRLEYRDELSDPSEWVVFGTNTLGPGTNVLLQSVPSEPRMRYYRARWMP